MGVPRPQGEKTAAGQQEVADYGREMEAIAAAVYLFDLAGKTVYRDYVDAHYQTN